MAITFKAEQRTSGSQGQLRKLRHTGKIPGVVYGKKLENPISISVDEKELLAILRSHPNALLEVDVPGAGKQPVMMTEVQRDSLSRNVMHIDFHQVNMNEEIKAQVRIDLVGEAQGVKEGGILQVLLHEIDVQCLPNAIPDAIEIDVSSLLVGENLLVSDLKLPKNVSTRVDGEQVVVAVLAPQKEEVEPEAAEDESAEVTAKAEDSEKEAE
ncbi:50S ribosomal protein L25/general stress protein Ctc [Paenibacillus nasutitermitis]|uniref:Large ribosomal subunit protein bL25 n=1 Tax=Paenibacillus nasutitermitis TaxID=1652958 RepID=A0A917E2T3_9BACL|nr:50S ribosomal protein L25/general stress protein Ctc [Paenibacillus nasutitermitis]GGD99499.1 general stress protein CTC [Paenibacillus nasutitermitis]